MFGKLKNSSPAKDSVSKEINESIKTLSYLARAEKYFDLELEKNGQMTKPLLKIVDVIEPLRGIYDSTIKLEKGQKIDANAKANFQRADEIIEVANDILALNPKGLVTSDKIALVKLPEKLNEAKKLAGLAPSATGSSDSDEVLLPKSKKKAAKNVTPIQPEEALAKQKPAKQSQQPVPEFPEESDEPVIQPSVAFQRSQAEATYIVEDFVPPTPPSAPVAAKQTPAEEVRSRLAGINLDQPLDWSTPQPIPNSGFKKIQEQPEPALQQWGAEHQAQSGYADTGFSPAPAPQPEPEPAAILESHFAAHENVYDLNASQPQAAPAKYNLPQKYLATSYAGMNLQEAAQIITDLATNPDNLEIVMLEHSSRIRPVSEGQEIIGDLLAIAPIADAFETGTEISDKKHLNVLKNADRIISVCKDISQITVDGFDKRKQKLFEKFVPYDIKRTVDMAKIAYPEVFSTGQTDGGVATRLLDFADVIRENSRHLDDQLFSSLIAQVVTQIAQYAEYNELGFRFDITTKKNRVVGKAESLTTRAEISALRAITFIPQIARHAQELLTIDEIPELEADSVTRALDLLQQVYIHARDNYSAQLQDLYTNKAS